MHAGKHISIPSGLTVPFHEVLRLRCIIWDVAGAVCAWLREKDALQAMAQQVYLTWASGPERLLSCIAEHLCCCFDGTQSGSTRVVLGALPVGLSADGTMPMAHGAQDSATCHPLLLNTPLGEL